MTTLILSLIISVVAIVFVCAHDKLFPADSFSDEDQRMVDYEMDNRHMF